jgi:hypothetical protein
MPAHRAGRRQTPSRRPGPLTLAALAVVCVTAGATAALVASTAARHPAAHETPRPSGPPVGGPAPAPPGGLPQVVLSDLRWENFHGVRLPASALDGPAREDAGLASGFTDSPRGALLAALNIGVRANAQWGPGIFTPTITAQMIGPDTTALLAAERAAYDAQATQSGVTRGAPLGPVYVIEEGFRWQDYSPAQASVDLLAAGPGPDPGSTVRAATRIQLRWLGGDWRVIAPPGGDWGNSAAPATTTDGFTLFPQPTAAGG